MEQHEISNDVAPYLYVRKTTTEHSIGSDNARAWFAVRRLRSCKIILQGRRLG